MPASHRDPPEVPADLPPDGVPVPRNATLLEVVAAVGSSFFGVRKGKAMRKDAVSIRPHQVIVVAVALVAIFVVALFFFVRMIARNAGV